MARIETAEGRAIGSGFLVPGRDLHPALPDEPLLLTNAYVVTHDPAVRERYTFSIFDGPETRARLPAADGGHHMLDVLWSSFDAGTSIVRLHPTPGAERNLPLAPPGGPLQRPQRVNIIGYPGGRDESLSIVDNEVLDADLRVVHYRIPTTGGSAAAPAARCSTKPGAWWRSTMPAGCRCRA